MGKERIGLNELSAPHARSDSDSDAEDRFAPRQLRRRASLETAPHIVEKKKSTGYVSIGMYAKRRRSLDSTRGLGAYQATMLHDLRSYFDATYRLNTIRERLREIAAEHGLTAKDMFDLVDMDGSGDIDADELGAMVAMLGVKVKQVDLVTLMELIDKSANGDCDLDEFQTWLDFRVDLSGRRKDPWDDYNDRKLLMRESLKFDPSLMEVMNSWWRLADADDSGSISKEEYIKLHINLQRALIKQKELDISKARALASQEWEFDSQGRQEMNRELFKLSFFQMADAWREGEIEPKAYTGFMGMLQTRMTTKDEDGNMCWAWERDILWDVKLWEKPLKQKPVRLSIQERALRDARKNRTDMKSKMDVGAITKEDLKSLLPQEIIEATMRMQEMRSVQRDWMAGGGRKPMSRSNPNARRTGLVMSFDLSAMSLGDGDDSSGTDTDSDSDKTPVENEAAPITSVTIKKATGWSHRLYETNDNKRDRGIKKSESKMKHAAEFQRRKTLALLSGSPMQPQPQLGKLGAFDEGDEAESQEAADPEEDSLHDEGEELELWKTGIIRGTQPVPPHEISVTGTRTANHPKTLTDHVCWEELGYHFNTNPSGGLGEYSMSQPAFESFTRPHPASRKEFDNHDITIEQANQLFQGTFSHATAGPRLYPTAEFFPSSPPRARFSQYVSPKSPSTSSVPNSSTLASPGLLERQKLSKVWSDSVREKMKERPSSPSRGLYMTTGMYQSSPGITHGAPHHHIGLELYSSVAETNRKKRSALGSSSSKNTRSHVPATVQQFSLGEEPWFTVALKKRVECINFAKEDPNAPMRPRQYDKYAPPKRKKRPSRRDPSLNLPVTLPSHPSMARPKSASRLNSSASERDEGRPRTGEPQSFAVLGSTAEAGLPSRQVPPGAAIRIPHEVAIESKALIPTWTRTSRPRPQTAPARRRSSGGGVRVGGSSRRGARREER